MRSKTRQRLIRGEYEYEMNKPSYEDHEVSENNFHYDHAMTNKDLIILLNALVSIIFKIMMMRNILKVNFHL